MKRRPVWRCHHGISFNRRCAGCNLVSATDSLKWAIPLVKRLKREYAEAKRELASRLTQTKERRDE